MSVKKIFLITSLFCGISFFLLNCFSLIGYKIASDITVSASDTICTNIFCTWELEKISPDTPITIQLISGDSVKGKYLGKGYYEKDQYNKFLLDFNESKKTDIHLPAVDEIVYLVFHDTNQKIKGSFVGFDLYHRDEIIVVSIKSKSDFITISQFYNRFISYKNNVKQEIAFILHSIKTITYFQPDSINIENLNQSDFTSGLPFLSYLIIQDKVKNTSIPLNTVQKIVGPSMRKSPDSNKALWGFYTGLVLDIGLAITFVIMTEELNENLSWENYELK